MADAGSGYTDRIWSVGVVGACAAARHGMARVRGLRLVRGLCEIGVVWVEVCGLVGMAGVVGLSAGDGRVGGRLGGALRLDRLRF